jgi:hypothetical protein
MPRSCVCCLQASNGCHADLGDVKKRFLTPFLPLCPKRHAAMQALFVAWYNFARNNEMLGKSTMPAMASGLSDHVWTIKEMIERAAE